MTSRAPGGRTDFKNAPNKTWPDCLQVPSQIGPQTPGGSWSGRDRDPVWLFGPRGPSNPHQIPIPTGPSCVGGPCVQRPVFAGFSAIFSVCALAQLYLKTLCVFFLSPLPRGVRGGSGLFVYQGNLLFWAESGPTGKARESLFEVWPRAGRPRNVFWESGPGPAATEPGFCQNGAAASADTFLIKNVFCFAADQLKFALHPCESPRDACRRPRPVGGGP